MKIKYYHFHLYYELENINLAVEVREKVSQAFEVEVGRLWEKPVTGDDIVDHTDSIMWVGKSYALNNDFFN